MAVNQGGLGPIFMFRNDHMGYTDMEKRQLFLRSYQFSRKKSVSEKIKGSFFRVKRVIWFRLRSAKKLRKMVWSRIKHGFFFTATRRSSRRSFLRLHSNYNNYATTRHASTALSSCFW